MFFGAEDVEDVEVPVEAEGVVVVDCAAANVAAVAKRRLMNNMIYCSKG